MPDKSNQPDKTALPRDPDESPFDKPKVETVEKGLRGPWEPRDDASA
jgi:hypothetical protein